MPKISIYERDLTTAGSSELTDNTVYIPGYAVIGPVNTPTLCESLEDFQEIFGYKPYKFRQKQDYPTAFGLEESYAFKDSYEKSYIYAAELLKNGLHVIFERFMPTSFINTWTAVLKNDYVIGTIESNTHFNIKAKFPGELGKDIKVTLTSSEYLKNTQGTVGKKYKLDAVLPKNVEKGIYRDLKDSITFTFDINRADYYENVINETKYIDVFIKGEPELVDFEGSNLMFTSTTVASSDEFIISNFYAAMEDNSLFEKLADRNEYRLKFITSGSYPTFDYNPTNSDNVTVYQKIVGNMLTVAAQRGDAIALIDHTNNLSKSVEDIYGDLNSLDDLKGLTSKEIEIGGDASKQEDARKYGAMFTPWATYESKVLSSAVILPASFAYLNSLAVSVRTNANWYAIAGVTRGLVPNLLQLSQPVTGSVANKIQDEKGISINPITNIKPYGYCIWGNRTLNENNGLVASSFLNVRNLASDVKKVVYTAAKKLTFELNTDVLWLNFKAEIEPTLDRMVSGNGLTGYKIMRKTSTKRATIEAVIRLYVVEAVENWDITVELSDTTVTVQ